MKDRLFSELLGATREALAHYRGEKRDLRTTVLPEPPRPMSRADVRRLRDRVKASQAVFAKCLNVSTKLVQAWEGGVRYPDGAALRLLRVAERAPTLVFGEPADSTEANTGQRDRRSNKASRGQAVRISRRLIPKSRQ
jgi:DNA-binding transcriptional regulator YiaG